MRVVADGLYRPNQGVVQAVHLVFLRIVPGNPGDPNVEVIGAFLTRRLADEMVRDTPGSWIEKIYAGKAAAPPGAAAVKNDYGS